MMIKNLMCLLLIAVYKNYIKMKTCIKTTKKWILELKKILKVGSLFYIIKHFTFHLNGAKRGCIIFETYSSELHYIFWNVLVWNFQVKWSQMWLHSQPKKNI